MLSGTIAVGCWPSQSLDRLMSTSVPCRRSLRPVPVFVSRCRELRVVDFDTGVDLVLLRRESIPIDHLIVIRLPSRTIRSTNSSPAIGSCLREQLVIRVTSSARRSATRLTCFRAGASRAGGRTSQVALSASDCSAGSLGSTFAVSRRSRSLDGAQFARKGPRPVVRAHLPRARQLPAELSAASSRRSSSQSRSRSVEMQSSRL